jgi:hypothetical protein
MLDRWRMRKGFVGEVIVSKKKGKKKGDKKKKDKKK